MDIPINARVNCLDGPCGRSTHVILMPVKEKITHLVVSNEVFPPTEFMIPIELVGKTTSELIQLNCTLRRFRICRSSTRLNSFLTIYPD